MSEKKQAQEASPSLNNASVAGGSSGSDSQQSTPVDSPAGVSQGSNQVSSGSSGAHEGYYTGNAGYGNYAGNTGGANKPYKHYNRQNYNGSNNGNSMSNNGNRQHYNNRKGYNQKINHNNQYNNYNSYPPNMYAYGYYPSPYGYATPMVPGMPPMQSFQQPPYSPLPGGKVKITTKEGKQIDLEEKKKLSNATNTPISSPSQGTASPVTSHISPVVPVATSYASVAGADDKTAKEPVSVSSSVSPSTSSAVTSSASPSTASPQPAASTGKLSVAEEFKRKILERAAKASAAQKKEESKTETTPKAVTPKVEAPAPASAPKTATPVAEAPREESPKMEEPKTEEPKTEEPKAEETKIEEPKTEEPKTDISNIEEPSTIKQVEEPKEESKEEPTQESADSVSQETKEPAEEVASESVEAKDEESKDDLAEDSEAKTLESEETEPKDEGQTISQFFEKLNTSSGIEDPFAVTYPSPFVGVDPRWKSETKKYRYDPQFLIQFRDVLQFPLDNEWKTKLENLGIVSTVNKRGAGSQSSRGMNKFGNSMSGRFNGPMSGRGQFNDGRTNSRSGSKRRGGSGGPRDKSTRKGNQSKRGGRDRDHHDDKPAEEVKPLEKSANRWVPRSKAKKTEVKLAPDGSEILDSEDIERKVKSLLNKLTLEMFEPITDDILKLANQSKWEDNAKTVREIISLTFAKACDEPYWSSMYAQFCAKMCTQMSDEIKDVNICLKNGEFAKGGDLARRILLTTCQTEYEKGWTDKLPTNADGTPLEPEMMSDEYYIMAAAKRRGLGLVKFIGHLYILNMLNDQVILLCLRDQSSNTKDPSEDSLENLTQLVNTVGARLETTDKNRAVLNFVFDNIQTILDNCKLSSRIKFMLMDLQDLRAAKWKSAKEEAGPKTIQEIHNDAEIKKLEEEKAAAERRRKNKSNDSRSNSSRGGSSWGNQSKKSESRAPTKDSRGFTSVQSSRSQSNRPNNASEQAASHLSPRENSKRTESIQSNANIFAALGEGDDEENNDDDHAHHQEAEHKDNGNEESTTVDQTENIE
mmetsp:Transcript_9337/g.11288  ORF Transcript_9337/g.11288 Transcript_9337/m.11288 type:complete len:1040 (+) Transcript_9337:242-3361(+)